jgi:hypothetical protein
MPAKAPARPLSNLRGLASRWDACFWVMPSGGIASLNRPAKGFDASGIGPVILSLINYQHPESGTVPVPMPEASRLLAGG